MRHIKRAKLFYIPGIISLIGVSSVFYFFKPAYQQQYALNFVLPTDKPDNELLLRFSSTYVYAEAKRRQQLFVDLNTDTNQTARKFDFIEQEILRLASSYAEKPSVLIVNLNNETRFADFTQLINLPQKLGLRQYAYAGNSFYFFGLEKPIVDPHTIEVVTGWGCGLLETEYVASKPKLLPLVIKWFQRTFTKASTWWLASYFLLIVFPSIVYNRQFQQVNK